MPSDPTALNDLLMEIVTSLLDQGGFADAPVSRMKKMKVEAAGRVAQMGLKQLERLGDPDKQAARLVDISNRYLPGVVDIVGEEAVASRVDRLPERVRGSDTVARLEAAGATELARLLRRDQPAAAPAVPAAGPAPAAPDRRALLEGQLALLEDLHRRIGEAIPRLRQALEE